MSHEQSWLPRFKEIPEVPSKPKARRPHLEYARSLSPHELLSHPLDLNFRGRLNQWLEKTQEESNFTLEEILPDDYLKLTRLYLYPQPPEGRWLNQSDVTAQVTGDPRTTMFREVLLRALIRVWRRSAYGPRAMEILKLSNFLYRSLIKREFTTIDEIRDADPEKILLVCGARPMFETLKERMQEHFPDWSPEVAFRQEMIPNKVRLSFN